MTTELLTVHAFKVGKADSILISHKGEYIMIDAGEENDGKKLVSYFKEHDISTLKALIITHFDKDHVGGADHLVKALSIEQLIVPNYDSKSNETKEFNKAIKKRDWQIQKLTEPLTLSIGDARATIYPPHAQNHKGDNDFSLVISLAFGDSRWLFAGDAEAPRLLELQNDPSLKLPHQFLKVPHHGRFNEQTTAFFQAVQPQLALITTSNKHPEDPATTAALQALGTKIFTTRDANLTFHSDGQTITVN